MSLSHVMCETAERNGNRNCRVQLQRRRQDCRTTDGQVQLPGKILLQAHDAVGKHCSLTGVGEREQDWKCVWVAGGRNCAFIYCFWFLIYRRLSGTKTLAQFAPTFKWILLSKVIVIQWTEQDCIFSNSERSTAAPETRASSCLMNYVHLILFSQCASRWKYKLHRWISMHLKNA